MTEEGVWGITTNTTRAGKRKYVHFYINGDAICGQHPHMDLIKDDWNPKDKDTCPKCRERHRWIEKGFHSPSDTVPHRPTLS